MMPIIITGGSSKVRLEEAEKIAESENISKNSPDFIFITPQNSIGIEKLREILPKINLKPYQSPKKIVIIEDAHKLTIEAQNSFLKTLEEPPQNTIILLLIENQDQLLPTIQSRCSVINLKSTNQIGSNSSNLSNEIIEIQNLSIGLKFKKAAEIASTRENAQKWLKNAILSLHESVSKSANLIIKCQEAQNKLSQNINTRLVIENLLIDL